MIVFKNYFRIVLKHLGIIVMFISISVGSAILNTTASPDEANDYRVKVAIFDSDDSDLSRNFAEYIDEFTEIVSGISNEPKEMQDALYNGEVNVILLVPEGFGADLVAGREPKIQMKKSIESLGAFAEFLINRYCFTAEMVSGAIAGDDAAEIPIETTRDEATVAEILSDYEWGEVEFMETETVEKTDAEKLATFYSFENYALLSILIFTIGTIMCVFNREEIRKRNLVSSLKPKSLSAQLFLGHLVLATTVWAIFVVISIIIYGSAALGFEGILFAANSLCFSFTATALAYLIGSLVKNQNVISGIQNTVALGLSFISGCFVPLEYLDAGLVNFSKIFPSYWFISGNAKIAAGENMLTNCFVVLGFGILYFVVAGILTRKKVVKSKKV